MVRRVLITGGAGLLGRALRRSRPPHLEAISTWRSSPMEDPHVEAVRAELSDPAATTSLLRRVRPDLVIHAAYGKAVPERDILAATRVVATAAAGIGARLIHVSTDALLDGESAPYDDGAAAAPIHDYGRWKAAAESAVREAAPRAAIVRPSLIVSFQPPDSQSRWVAECLRSGRSIRLFVDEIRSPIRADDLAAQLWEIASSPEDRVSGVWNLAGPESLSRYALGLLIAAHEGLDPGPLLPVTSDRYPVPRPRDLRLLTGRADRELRHRARSISSLVRKEPGARRG